MKKLLVLPGDGIGREVCDATLPVLNILSEPLKVEYGKIGWDCWKSQGNPVPDETWKQIDRSDAVLLGAITSKGKNQAEAELAPELQRRALEYVSPVIQLRQRLDLFANVRPVEHLIGNRKPFRCCVIRENTEGLYVGMDQRGVPEHLRAMLNHPNLERSGPDQATFSVRLQTRFGLERLFRHAFEYARREGHDRVTLADKPNVLRESGQFAADIFYSIASEYPEISADIQNVDAVALWLVKRPEEFGVIVAENMFGDILSDLAAGVMGGVGVAPSANVGNRVCYFEPVHGSAPRMADKDRANPSAMFLSLALTLSHLGFDEAAASIRKAVRAVIVRGRFVTYDLGGNAGTKTMAKAILDEVAHPSSPRRTSVLCVGDELLRGQYVNDNGAEFSRRLDEVGCPVSIQIVCGDQLASIRNALDICLGQSDLVIVSGGLGPTSDDVTRDALAASLGKPLVFDESSWNTIESRLTGFGLSVAPSNRRQAMFPEGADILPNPNGTAPGFSLCVHGKTVHVLPGPPSECLPMLHALLARERASTDRQTHSWRLLGVIESDIAETVDLRLGNIRQQADIGYLWRYPYVDVRISLPAGVAPEAPIAKLDVLFSDYLVSRDGSTAMERLGKHLPDLNLLLEDEMTQGTFSARLAHMAARSDSGSPVRVSAKADGALDEKFQGRIAFQCQIQLGALRDSPCHEYRIEVPKRGPEIIDYACEFIAWSILRALSIQI